MKDKLYKMMNWPEIEAIVYGDEGAPQTILGRHIVSNYTLYQTFNPSAKKVELVIEGEKKGYPMELVDEAGFFAVAILGKNSKSYQYKITYSKDKESLSYDPYIFDTSLNEDDVTRWTKGISYNSYDFMGSHMMSIDGISGCMFRVWAPNAIRVSVVGEFNDYNGKSNPMIFDAETGIFSLFIPGIDKGTKYQYEINAKGGKIYTKADPYSLYNNENGVSRVCQSDNFNWDDTEAVKKIRNNDLNKGCISIYEIDSDYFNNNGITEKSVNGLCEYVNDMGYSHVLINMQSEDGVYCIYDNSNAEDLKKMLNTLHKAYIGVLFKWSPTCFSASEYGLKEFDGTFLYGHEDEKKRYNAVFGLNYNYSRPEIVNYLLSNAMYIADEFHVDGFHVDELSTILYLDFGRNPGDFIPNIYGGPENLDAFEFVKHFNSIIHKNHKGILTTTKEICMCPNITASLKEDGMGFDMMWDNGLTEDYIKYVRNQSSSLHLLTDNMSYAYSENYINTISKEDVVAANDNDYDRVEGGASFYDYIAYEDKNKASVKRATNAFYMSRPGKKLFFLGQDDVKIMPELNKMYRSLPAFHTMDNKAEGFEWVSAMDNGNGIIAYIRKDDNFTHNILVVCNFSLNEYEEYKLGMPYEGKYKLILNSEEKRFGGTYKAPSKVVETFDEDYDGYECTLNIAVPALSVSYYSYTPYSEAELMERAQKKADRIKAKLKEEAVRIAKELEEQGLQREAELLQKAREQAEQLKKYSKKK